MIITDAGPLIALLNRGDAHHEACLSVTRSLRGPMLTTWPAFTEAMHLLGAGGGWPAQSQLWRLLQRGTLQLADLREPLMERMATLMERNADLPMDLADASLVALADQMGRTSIFSVDPDFHVYRLADGRGFTVLP